MIKFLILTFLIQLINAHEKGDVWLTVSSLAEKSGIIKATIKQRFVEINWRNIVTDNSKWIGLFDKNLDGKRIFKNDSIAFLLPHEINGLYRTKIEFPVIKFNESELHRTCLLYHVALVKNDGLVVKNNCLTTEPRWMEENSHYLMDKPISRILIPGTHDAGSYSEGYPRRFSVTDRYSLCQDESIFNQLVYGIRYVDLRVRYEDSEDEKYWITHDFIKMPHKLRYVLKEIRNFIDKTEKEIIIIDFHRFPHGFDSETREKHLEIVDILRETFEDYLAVNERAYHVTFGDLIRQGKRVIIGYAGKKEVPEVEFLFHRARHVWAESDDEKDLRNYFEQNLCSSSPYQAEVAMAELTPTVMGIVLDRYGGLRKLASDVNRPVSDWFAGEYYDCANIVATDFFLGNDIVNLAIRSAKERKFWY